ncbi:MAG: DUF2127 domain-containing protein [Acidobacteriota bacterium]|nr:DUF2127 domain-containing protein [Acidobacteriota bacterium]
MAPPISKRAAEHPLLHYFFELGIGLKFLNGLLEVVGGIGLFFTTPESLNKVATAIFKNELLRDSQDFVANHLLHAVQRLSANAQLFASIYLLVHGVVKVGLVIALWKKRLWAYPLAGIILVLFTIYQVYLFAHSGSLLQLFLTALDVIILVLLWFEYKRIASHLDSKISDGVTS